MKKKAKKHQLTTLGNGFRVLSFPMAGRESVSLGVWTACGGRYEEVPKAGMSHFIEHLVFKGTKNYTALEIKKAIEGVGGYLNAFTAEEFTCYMAKVTPKYLKQAISVLSEMVICPRLALRDFEKEKFVILEEIKLYLDIPMHHVVDVLFKLLWPNQSLGIFLAGTYQTVSDLTHKELKNFMNTHYTTPNMGIIACGDISHGKLVKEVDSNFRSLRDGTKNVFEEAKVIQGNKPKVKFIEKKLEQTHLAVGFHISGRKSPKRFTEALLNIILGANMSSRLFQEVREKRSLAYEIHSQTRRYDEAGVLVINGGIHNDKKEEALKVILGELKKLKVKAPSSDELKRAKEYFRGQFKLALEDTTERMIWLGENLITLDKIENEQYILREIDKVTPRDIKNTASEIFKTSDLNLSAIGPLKSKEEKSIEHYLNL